MSHIAFIDVVRLMMGNAANIYTGMGATPDQIERTAAFLQSARSGPSTDVSFESFALQKMVEHPPILPSGMHYVFYSGIADSTIANFRTAKDYAEQDGGGGRSGIVGDSPWGAYVNKVKSTPELRVMERKFAVFLVTEQLSPFTDDVGGALQFLLWTMARVKFMENACAVKLNIVAFVENG